MADGSHGFEAAEAPVLAMTGPGEFRGHLDVVGTGNTLFIGEGAWLDGQVMIRGDNNRIVIGAFASVTACIQIVTGDACLDIGPGSGVNKSCFNLNEPGSIRLGAGCNTAHEVWFSNSDMHPIYDVATGERINAARDIVLEDDVWVGFRSTILKGATIGRGSMIGAGSTVSGEIGPATIAAGSPARPIRTGVCWKWCFDQPFDA